MPDESRYFSGEALWGDDFEQDQLAAWLDDETEGYANLGAAEYASADSYGYHALNIRHGFRHLPNRRFSNALGLGSSYGGEFLPIIDRLDRITILEPSSRLRTTKLEGIPVNYIEPRASGDMPFADSSFDLVISFDTLHHIANVSHVIDEMGRVMAQNAYALIREPIRSMGDWRSPRPGLTRRERGIPLNLFHRAFAHAELRVIREVPCMFPTTRRLHGRGLGYDRRLGVFLDEVLSAATSWNNRYHSTKFWHKIHPVAMFFVLRR